MVDSSNIPALSDPNQGLLRFFLRSGLAAKNFIDVGAGVVDEDYRGPLGVVLFNHADVPFEVRQGDRIAQVILQLPIALCECVGPLVTGRQSSRPSEC